MKFTVLLPLADNNGKKFSRRKLDGIVQRLGLQFGGCTVEGEVRGLWLDGETIYRDRLLKVVVVADSSRVAEARTAVEEIGRELQQLAMYFEVVLDDGVEIIRIE